MSDPVVRSIRNVNGDSPHVEIECELPDGSTFSTRASREVLQDVTTTLKALVSERIILSDRVRIRPLEEVIDEITSVAARGTALSPVIESCLGFYRLE